VDRNDTQRTAPPDPGRGISPAGRHHLIHAHPARPGAHERGQDRLVDADRLGVVDHRVGLAGQHRENLLIDAHDGRIGGVIVEGRRGYLSHDRKTITQSPRVAAPWLKCCFSL
jgi:hypothetical protein